MKKLIFIVPVRTTIIIIAFGALQLTPPIGGRTFIPTYIAALNPSQLPNTHTHTHAHDAQDSLGKYQKAAEA